jgi:hypothetical protein
MLSLIDARAAGNASRYHAVIQTSADLEALVAQGIKPSDIGNVLGIAHKQQQPTFFELLKANPEYISAFDTIQSTNVSPLSYMQFLQKRAGKEISFGGKTQTAFEYVRDIATKGDQSVAKQLIETKTDWTTYAHLDELYQLVLQQGILVPVVKAYLGYGAQKSPNKQRIILQAARLQASAEEVKMIRGYIDFMCDEKLETIAAQNYESIDSMKNALTPTEQPRIAYIQQAPTASLTDGNSLDTLCNKPGIQEDSVRHADAVLAGWGYKGVLQQVDTQHPELTNRVARSVNGAVDSGHPGYVRWVIGEPNLFEAYLMWLKTKPSQPLNQVLQKIPIGSKYVLMARAALMRK